MSEHGGQLRWATNRNVRVGFYRVVASPNRGGFMADAVYPWSTRLIETFAAQLLALLTFFLFPAMRYLYLKHLSSGEGAINLSYSPKYGYRLAAANQIGKRVLSELRWNAVIRGLVPTR